MNGCKNCPAFGKCTVTYRGSACAARRSTYGIYDDPEIITNADRIRAMSDEELANLLTDFSNNAGWASETGRQICYEQNQQWLQQPAKEETT